jgi:hypothetical protein
MLSGNIPNRVTSLEEEMVEKIHHKPQKKKHLANNGFANAISLLNNKFLSAITTFVENKVVARSICIYCLAKFVNHFLVFIDSQTNAYISQLY